MPAKADDLLARLNALKPSQVDLHSTPKASIDVETARPQSLEDRLAARLKGLRSGGSTLETQSAPDNVVKRHESGQGTAADTLTEQVKDEISADPLLEWQQDGNEQSVDDLLAELETNEQAQLNPDDPDDVATLLRQARDALPTTTEGGGDTRTTQTAPDHGEKQAGSDDEDEADRQDDQDADDYVARLLAELDIDKKYGAGEEVPPEKSSTENGDLVLPSGPSHLDAASLPPSYEHSELESRFSKLGRELPSTPTSAPSSKAKVSAASALAKAKAKTKAPTYTDDDIYSWCCICNEDGEVRCLGCDDDIYCQNCWNEGHGNKPGQERGHKAVTFVRKAGSMAAA